ncbi:unnamed protein product [Allacma fusca]|uniref:Uncharacterized protein n=1 Tax=Allacma fusca TaxID=39272 RepID=A0A8J2JT98_9HEXA|nr:unnamed protein product [Allacma fusca]
MLNLSCENVCPTELPKCTYLNAFIKNLGSADETPGFFELQYAHGNKSFRQRIQAEDRRFAASISKPGYNSGYKDFLNMDMESKAFAYMFANGIITEVSGVATRCSSPDESSTVFLYTGNNCTCEKTFSINYASEICTKLRHTSSSFEQPCDDYNENTNTRNLDKTLAGAPSCTKAPRNNYVWEKIQDQEQEVPAIARLGYNPNCKYLLHVDMESGAFACMLADGSEKEVPSVFLPCSNLDECNASFNYTGDNCAPGMTFKTNNCTSEICSELLDTPPLFVLACGDYNENSVARGFYKTLVDIQSRTKTLRTYEGITGNSVRYEDMITIQLSSNEPVGMTYAKNKSVIYTKYPRDFECRALKPFFSHGFLWKLLLENKTEIYLGTGNDTTDDDLDVYISKKTIWFDSPLITSVVCEAPNWNELTMTNFTMHSPFHLMNSTPNSKRT